MKKPKKFDNGSEGTIRIITKPNLINDGTQARIAALSTNEDTAKLKLAFIMDRNPSTTGVDEGIDSMSTNISNKMRLQGLSPRFLVSMFDGARLHSGYSIGSTKNVVDAQAVVAALQSLTEWIQNEHRPWFDEMNLQPLLAKALCQRLVQECEGALHGPPMSTQGSPGKYGRSSPHKEASTVT